LYLVVYNRNKLKLYWSIIRPIVVYGCETWVFKGSITQRISVLEWKILRKIFGPTKEGIWRNIQTRKWMTLVADQLIAQILIL